MSTIGERRHSGSSHETPRNKKRKFVDHSPSMKKKLEELKSRTFVTVESQHDSQLQLIKQDFEHLRQAIVAQQETLKEMQKTIDEDGGEIEDLKKKVRALEAKVEELENKLNIYKEDDCILDLNFVTNIFEMAICWHVMPDVYYGDKRTSRIQDLP